jgi:hypothetical protein
MTGKSNKSNSDTAVVPIDLTEQELIEVAPVVVPDPVEEIKDSVTAIKERCRGYLLARKSPINLGIAEIARKLNITEAQASDALIALDKEGAIEISLVRVTVTVKEHK